MPEAPAAMDIRALRYFTETVRLNSFSRAADTLHVTQSTVSKMVRQLEDEVDAPLLIRDGRRLQLTDTGRVVYEQGQQILASMQRLDAEVRDTKALRCGRLEIGIPPMINILCTPVLKAFRERHPEIAIVLKEDTGPQIEQRVASGELEIGMTVLPADPDLELQTLPVARYPMWAVAQAGSFQKNRATLRCAQLDGMPLVLLNNEFGLTRSLRGVFREQEITPRIVAQSAQWDWLVAMALAGMGAALLPEPFIHRLASDQLQAVRLVEPEVQWQVAYVTRGAYLSHAARAWMDISAELFAGGRGRK
ncbi:LysR family transcriptional regulator [Herbaspirillum rubrisubalbicans]|uniref:LysR family transcriptional regulator n=3 Tax=Herbaspirillum rubrisubalbicans TaxID=80842 RepID=A0AAD0U3Y6_9BURK|nr:LysR family transcriptional regulator [Herbaspirillum rubrisubalbicans]MCP1575413.1 DNA-binding transcriptional LysR family regulator [Herbaspirillum rubrisubalbicans]QJP98729.1 LysR family transcriptional regulator [Herbaspirillum rubrisubalbicans Os34]RAM62930.1 LysR family transcriptional regulator [Herbaspirillum rubrisubalbicans]RAN46698.1 LysR family transcriptional regulator [Herbaspirillum rubrisubalbicans]